ncbi:MAG: septum formation initiator family protein [Beijerinckiaceae bacterium]|jgi:cell division protein FtsB|nr:septum formation initiator family protein [Beijerinckiaceae bacterium]
MVRRRGPARFLAPLAFYLAAGAAAAYFIYHAHNGPRGLETKQELSVQIAELDIEIARLREERAEWEQRVALMRRDEVDRDLLEERARASLGRVHRNDVVIIGR